MSFADELHARVAPHTVLSDLLGCEIAPKGETRMRCFRPASHNNGDANPSLDVSGETGLFKCWGCGVAGDAVKLVVALGLAADDVAAIQYLRERYDIGGGSRKTAAEPGAAPRRAPSDDAWPWYPESVTKFGWKIEQRNGRTCLVAPVFDQNGERCGTKIRGPRGEDGKLFCFLEEFEGRKEPGLMGDVTVIETIAVGKLVFLVAGETDSLALRHFADREGVVVVILTHSNGEGFALGELAKLLRGLRVAVVYDVDDIGRKGAAARVEELRAAGVDAFAVVLPLPGAPKP